MRSRSYGKASRDILLAVVLCSILLFLTGCQDVTPGWWSAAPSGFLGWKELLWRVLVLLIPIAVVSGAYFASDKDIGGCTGFTIGALFPFLGVFILALAGIVLLWILSYGLGGVTWTVSYLFACFCISCLVIGGSVLGMLLGLFAGDSALKKALGFVGLVIEGFGIFFTLRDIYGLIPK